MLFHPTTASTGQDPGPYHSSVHHVPTISEQSTEVPALEAAGIHVQSPENLLCDVGSEVEPLPQSGKARPILWHSEKSGLPKVW